MFVLAVKKNLYNYKHKYVDGVLLLHFGVSGRLRMEHTQQNQLFISPLQYMSVNMYHLLAHSTKDVLDNYLFMTRFFQTLKTNQN